MNKTAVAAAALAGTAALSGAAIMPGSATASSKVTIMHLKLHQSATHSLGKFTFGGTDVDRSHGKVVGFDSITGRFDPKSGNIRIDVAFALRGGIITARVTNAGSATKYKGTILGGTGKYAGASGKIRGHSPSENSPTTFIILRLR